MSRIDNAQQSPFRQQQRFLEVSHHPYSSIQNRESKLSKVEPSHTHHTSVSCGKSTEAGLVFTFAVLAVFMWLIGVP